MSGPELVTLTVDGVEVQVPKGTNLIEAAEIAGAVIPHYCYHSHLSIAGNCRMCQVKVQGMPKLTIACNTGATQGMVVQTHRSSPEVAEAQRATLEFLLINHPLDCTVCDQAGHCKLQDYYFEYNAKSSRFIEDKEHKVKAEPLGPEVIYDGERCILCTRCVRFCDEVTHTGELGAFNRGDKTVIGIFPGNELNNALSGSVVDLCPVGALTHRRWRFNTRIWYTEQTDTVCPGCSTGCNIKVAVRDNQIVQVKARKNSDVNEEWLCDEGRYGFERFQPDIRLLNPLVCNGGACSEVGSTEAPLVEATWDDALVRSRALRANGKDDAALFLSPLLTLEEAWIAVEFAERVMGISRASGRIAMAYRERPISEVEKVLVSPDYAANARAAEVLGILKNQQGGKGWRVELQELYQNLLRLVRAREIKRVLFVGDGSLWACDIDDALLVGLRQAESISLLPREMDAYPMVFGAGLSCGFHNFSKAVFPTQIVLEKNGLLVNGDGRVQRLRSLLRAPTGALSEWVVIKKMAETLGVDGPWNKLGKDERELSRAMLKAVPALSGFSLAKIGDGGRCVGCADDNSDKMGSAS